MCALFTWPMCLFREPVTVITPWETCLDLSAPCPSSLYLLWESLRITLLLPVDLHTSQVILGLS